MSKKAEVTQIFVYLVSIIIILFAGFLVTTFIVNFMSDTEIRTNTVFVSEIKSTYDSVLREWNSERSSSYSVSRSITQVCFISQTPCQEDKAELNLFGEGGDNIVLFDSNGPILSDNIGEFMLSDSKDCECFIPINSRINIKIENQRNTIRIDEVTT